MAKINTNKELFKKLGINSIEEIKKPKVQKKLVQLIGDRQVSKPLLRRILNGSADVLDAFNKTIGAMESIGTSLEETKRLRWEVLRDLANKGSLDSEQVLEAMQLIERIEGEERIDWERILERAIYVGGVLVLAVVFVLSRGRTRPPV